MLVVMYIWIQLIFQPETISNQKKKPIKASRLSLTGFSDMTFCSLNSPLTTVLSSIIKPPKHSRMVQDLCLISEAGIPVYPLVAEVLSRIPEYTLCLRFKSQRLFLFDLP